jgi:hypothetical protein
VSNDHLSLDELAELDEGLLPGERLSAVQAHMHDCGQCRTRAEGITSTRAMLAALPAVTMPADVSARLDQTLAAAAPGPLEPRVEEPTVPPAATDNPAVLPAPDHPDTIVPNVTEIHRSRFNVGRPSAAAAALVIIFAMAVTAVVIGYHNRSSSGGSAGSASAGTGDVAHAPGVIASDQPRNLTKSSTGQTYTAGNLDSLIPGLVGSVTTNNERIPATTAPAPVAGSPTFGASQTPTTTHSDTRLTNQAVAPALKALASSTSKLLGCAARITTQADAVPLEVDFGYWTDGAIHKAPAAIFVFKAADPSKLAVYVTNATCSGNTLIRTYRSVNVAP